MLLSSRGSEAPPIRPFPGKAPTVLVVEDDAATRDMYRQALMLAGYNVRAVSDGIDALQLIETDMPDAVILDLVLSRVGGVDVYRELRARPETSQLPVIIVTGSDARELQPNQVQFFLRKPLHPDQVVTAVEAALNQH